VRIGDSGSFRAGAVIAFLIGAMILVSFFYIPYGFNDMDSKSRFKAPEAAHFMGTDNFGRDVFSRVMTGGRYTILVAILTVTGSAAAGAALGMFSGYAGGVIDEIVMRFMDALSSFPGIFLALVMVALLGNSHVTLIIALLILFIPSFTRVMRSGALQYKNRDFVQAAVIAGASRRRVIFVHILPNLLPSLLSASVLGLSNAILAESTMSYLGLGIQPPVPSWGRMLAESQNYLFNAPWCALAPGLMIMLTVLAFHFLGEGLRRMENRG
jgi:peptide/nickel transport system permease protein